MRCGCGIGTFGWWLCCGSVEKQKSSIVLVTRNLPTKIFTPKHTDSPVCKCVNKNAGKYRHGHNDSRFLPGNGCTRRENAPYGLVAPGIMSAKALLATCFGTFEPRPVECGYNRHSGRQPQISAPRCLWGSPGPLWPLGVIGGTCGGLQSRLCA